MRHIALIALVASFSSAACTMNAEEEILQPNADLIDRSTHALTSGSLEWLNGTYGTGCKNPATGAAHEATDAWSLRIAGSADMDHAALKVVKGDSDCELTLTGIKGAAMYAADPAIAMGSSYKMSASSFAAGSDPRAFYANAKLSATSMAANFTVHVLFSDDLAAASPSNKDSSYAQFSGSFDGGSVAAPAYSSVNTIALTATEDNHVSSTTGKLTLTVGAQAGEEYRVIDSELASATFASVDEAWNASGGGAPAVAISGSPVDIASADIIADGSALPAARTVIVRHVEEGVPAYEIFPLTFGAAPLPAP
jgi:hypothetical protein